MKYFDSFSDLVEWAKNLKPSDSPIFAKTQQTIFEFRCIVGTKTLWCVTRYGWCKGSSDEDVLFALNNIFGLNEGN